MDSLKMNILTAAGAPADVDRLRRQPAPGTAARPSLEQTCREMESLFLYQLLKQMRATVEKSGLLDGGSAEELYTSMLDAEVAKEVSRGKGIGLAELLYRQLAEQSSGDGGK